MSYDLELEIAPGATTDEFAVRVVRAVSGGTATATMRLDTDTLLVACRALEDTVLASAVSARRTLSSGEQRLRDIGRQLFDGVFSGDIEDVYRVSSSVASERREKLRLMLRVNAPQLVGLPWEAMYDSKTGKYVCLGAPLVRHVEAPTPEPLTVEPPIRVLGLVASPSTMTTLDVNRERDRLMVALRRPIDEGRLHVEWLMQATWDDVHDKLLSDTWHVLHFIGHGDYDPTADQGVIALVDSDGSHHAVGADRLAGLLDQANPTPRLVVLNSCESGRGGSNDLFSSTAATLVRGGISAVAAMQFTVSDSAAIAFSRAFYSALANGRSIDEAARSGRVGILGAPGTLEWVTPVLYVRGDTTHLFNLKPVPSIGTRAGTAVATPADSAPPEPRPHRQWWRRKRVVMAGAAAAVIAVLAVAISVFVTKPDRVPLFQGYILAQKGIEARAEPKLSSRPVGYLHHLQPVFIVCTEYGDVVEGPGSGGPTTTTALWDRVRDTDGNDRGFVPDVWVKTGTTDPQGPPC
jgi:CHAT domain